MVSGAKQTRLYNKAKKFIPSGVNSPVRAFKAVGGTPVFVMRGKGPFIWDEDKKRYLDFCCSWGPLLFGHAPDALLKRLRSEISKGTSFGVTTRKEVDLAERICSFFPSVEKVRLVSSGTEAVMSAVRLARGFTGRQKILKIDGGYHGHVDSLLVKAGSGLTTFGIADSAGVPPGLAKQTISVPFNDEAALERVFKREGRNIAAMILEPVPANMGVVLPADGYLKHARLITKKYGAVLIFDEVITGFRVAKGGAQDYFGVRPDLTCLGKVLGGGFPLAAFGGKRQIMNYLAPSGPVYQAGTLSGNPVAVSAALWMLTELDKRDPWERLNHRAENFIKRLRAVISVEGYPYQLNSIRSMFTLFFCPVPVTDFASAKKSDTRRFSRFFHLVRKEGVYLAPSQFEANFISTAHSERHLETALKVFRKALKKA
ncbi:MAG: glutamate-1-semialdehyde 2,1-aminomutase [Candidatus Omnitrophota bacterium]|nr:glutamate-1-semialdehyde 2,1-aminomutase [Candidatus Omnitrophota bacterium]